MFASEVKGRWFKSSREYFISMEINKRDEAKIINTPHGSEIRPLVDRTNSAVTQCSLAEEILPVGKKVSKHFHKNTEEIYYVLEGAGEMTVGNETMKVNAGDVVYIPKNHAHTLENTGETAMKILLVCGPAHNFADHFPE